MDFRIKAEENKAKYLDMFTTKLFLNEEEIFGLTKGSSKELIIICPFCSKQKVRRFCDVEKTGHTLCSGCSKSLRTNILFLGTKKGRLLIYDIALPYQGKKQWYGRLSAVCDCGVSKDYFVSELKESGETFSCGCLNREISRSRVGELSASWNPALTDEERIKRRNNYTKSWASAVKKRDNFTCQVCGSTEKPVAHHLNSYASAKDRRYDIENGVTMCRDCHTDFHTNFLENYRVPCNEQDFEDYLLQV